MKEKYLTPNKALTKPLKKATTKIQIKTTKIQNKAVEFVSMEQHKKPRRTAMGQIPLQARSGCPLPS